MMNEEMSLTSTLSTQSKKVVCNLLPKGKGGQLLQNLEGIVMEKILVEKSAVGNWKEMSHEKNGGSIPKQKKEKNIRKQNHSGIHNQIDL